MVDMTVADARVLIAGGSSGMGLALAQRCLADGAHVFIVGRNQERLNRAGKHLGGGSRLEAIVADVTRESDVAGLFARVGELDHIVCTAADIRGAYELLPALDLDAARRAVESKVFGPLLLAKHGAGRLAPSGSITLTSGIAAYRPLPRGTVVAAVNAALEGLVRALAVELAPQRVNAVSPGWVDTPIWAFVAGDRKDEMLDTMARRLPVGRVGRAADIAEAITFLMNSTFTTGTVLHVEGGHRLI
ncbi:SDR family oxidoreductase [Bradyrhizobium sp. U87765 SZCCT0131]|uniref:SDR family oxidoreductase n=2 Tax=Bradyrhizobium TaxID=374 RepID=UPI001BAD968C|nr:MULTISPECIES: SDR family oxidoreductase [unclassified Bradyrhizobium]MBR1218770.1 SDR family oxidoreductase [Bradyrhizobium sp. U87765 SZCCT0131]MBR1265471.1 SDR family oxidoreductase [Bradyrhizobium sp. U87765 SZCCT0134]MBR1304269.1 SDR family oxidoreductase [Bradyrhizobium sp. U87765 SZCCT0110]MBR1319874.1 SDR family oxidoreductase [Bradyrhizobium sp. U87765 SZCCT0109]MBR1348200.1 SDR family oxidoreductase [Bradyrhizobium sp. U87765 SZCCT0048]